MPDWDEHRDILATRDVAAMFRVLVAEGWTQIRISDETGIRQSDVSEIIHGRRVTSVRVLERVAEGLGIRPGLMGLAFTIGSPRKALESPDLVGLALDTMTGEQAHRVSSVLDPATEYRNVGKTDAHVINEYFLAIQRIEQQHSGQLVPAQGLIHQIRAVLRAEMSETVRLRLARMEGWVHSFAGWCAIDAGDFALGMSHFSSALEIAGRYEDPLGKCRALFSAGKAEMHYGDPVQALKLYQLATVPAGVIRSKLYDAALSSHSAWAMSRIGDPRHVNRYIGQTWTAYESVKPENEYEGMHSFFNRTDILGVTGQAQVASRPETAISDLQACLADRNPESRSAVFETATLAHAYLSAGYTDKALETGQRALERIPGVRSARTGIRLAPLKRAAEEHGSRDLADLAEMIPA